MLIPNNFAQANFKFTGPTAPTGAEVTCGFDVAGFAGNPSDAAAVLYDHWDTTWSNLQTDGVTLAEVAVKFGPTATGPSGTFAGSTGGKITGASATPAVSLLVQKVTSLGGRAGRGRLYMPSITEVDVNASGTVDPAYLAVAVTEWDDFHSKCQADSLGPVLLHGADSPVTTPTGIDAFVPQSIVATQRRRQRR